MTTRVLVAAVRADGQYALYRTVGPTKRPARDAVASAVSTDGPEDNAWQATLAPCGTARTFSAVVNGLDFAQFDALYRVSAAHMTAFCPLWFGFGHYRPTTPTVDPVGDGVVVEVRSRADAAALGRWFRAAKDDVAAALAAGRVDGRSARRHLLVAVRRRVRDRPIRIGATLRSRLRVRR